MPSCKIYMVNDPISFDLVLPRSVSNIFWNWLHGINHRFKKHIRVGVITVFWSLWLCRNDKMLTIKTLLFFRCVPILSVYGRLYSMWRIKTCLWRYVYGWMLQRGLLFLNMGGSVTCTWNLLLLRKIYNFSL
jgi:hypothetical protein